MDRDDNPLSRDNADNGETFDPNRTDSSHNLSELLKRFGNDLDYRERVTPFAQGRDHIPPLKQRRHHDAGISKPTPYHVKGMDELPDPLVSAGNYCMKGLINPGDLSVWYGPPGCGKSFLLLYVMYCIAMGLPVFGRRVRKTSVLYVVLEAATGFERRLAAVKKPDDKADNFKWITQPVDLFSNQDNVEGLILAAQSCGAGIIVIDTLARAFGAGNENESGDMGKVLAAVDRICCGTGAHVALIHHCGKNDDRGPRGHSSLMAAADLVIQIKRQDPGPRTARVAKSKDGVDGEELTFALKVVELGQDNDGDPVTTCIVLPSSEPAEPRKRKLTGQTKAAYDLLVRAINDGSQPAPGGIHFPRDINVVPVTLWRKYCYEGMGGKRDKPDSVKKAFNRAFTNLKNYGHINSWGDFVWVL